MTFVYVFVLTEIAQQMAVDMTFVYVFVLTEIPQHMAVNMTFVYVFFTESTDGSGHDVCVRV